MCKNADNRIVKLLPGEMISINAESLSDETCKSINDFILFARAYTKLKNNNANENLCSKQLEK